MKGETFRLAVKVDRASVNHEAERADPGTIYSRPPQCSWCQQAWPCDFAEAKRLVDYLLDELDRVASA